MSSGKVNYKRTAFTLAEVLITLGIIGVVPALTIPALINRYQISEYETELKVVYSTLTEGFKRIMAEYECTDLGYTGIFTANASGSNNNSTDPEFNRNMDEAAKRIFKTVKSYKANEISSENAEKVNYLKGDKTDIMSLETYIMQLPSGATVYIQNYGCTDTSNKEVVQKQICGWITVDVNGSNKPNTWGKDVFGLGRLYSGGTISPSHSLTFAQSYVGGETAKQSSYYWRNAPAVCGTPGVKLKNDTTNEIQGRDCYARILENDFKMDYLR